MGSFVKGIALSFILVAGAAGSAHAQEASDGPVLSGAFDI